MGLLLRRALLAITAATLTMTALVVLLAWVSLRVSWAIPDPGALAGPTELLDRDGETIARFTAEIDREVVDLDQIAPEARAAVVQAEDARFYEHSGVDPLSVVRAVVTNVRTGGITQGGSTLTQQYVKAAFVGDERTLLRKVREAVISLQLERDVSKEEILERYLNAVYFGQGAYGIEAAAQTYFDVGADELDVGQGATLAQLLPAPSVRNPVADPGGARQRRDALLERMAEAGRLDPASLRGARGSEIELASHDDVEVRAPAFVDHVRRQLEHAFGEEVMHTGALTVRTSLDLSAQQALDAVAAEHVPGGEHPDVDTAMVALDPRSGEIRAMHGGREMAVGNFNLATMTRRQNGSAFKPFVYAAALEEDVVEPDTTVPTPTGTTITDCVGHDGGPISVAGGPGGSRPAREALVHSANTTFQRLGCEVGGERVIAQARRLGVRNEIPPSASAALGGASHGASVLDMASSFGTFANDGAWCPPRTILEITGPEGGRIEPPAEVLTVPDHPSDPHDWDEQDRESRPEWLEELADERDTDCRTATHPAVARAVTDALVGVVERGTGTRADIGRPQAGKTGTTQELKDAWFVGYTPSLSLSVWIGDTGRDGSVDPLPPLGGFSQLYGGTLPATMWSDAAGTILEGREPASFPDPLPLDLEVSRDGPQVAPARDVPSRASDPPPQPPEDGEGSAPDAPAPDGEGDQGADEPSDPPPEDGGEQDDGGQDDPSEGDRDPEEEDEEDEEEDEDCLLLC